MDIGGRSALLSGTHQLGLGGTPSGCTITRFCRSHRCRRLRIARPHRSALTGVRSALCRYHFRLVDFSTNYLLGSHLSSATRASGRDLSCSSGRTWPGSSRSSLSEHLPLSLLFFTLPQRPD